jgi:hypothetical protein
MHITGPSKARMQLPEPRSNLAIMARGKSLERHAWATLTPEAHLIKLARGRRVAEDRGIWRLIRS